MTWTGMSRIPTMVTAEEDRQHRHGDGSEQADEHVAERRPGEARGDPVEPGRGDGPEQQGEEEEDHELGDRLADLEASRDPLGGGGAGRREAEEARRFPERSPRPPAPPRYRPGRWTTSPPTLTASAADVRAGGDVDVSAHGDHLALDRGARLELHRAQHRGDLPGRRPGAHADVSAQRDHVPPALAGTDRHVAGDDLVRPPLLAVLGAAWRAAPPARRLGVPHGLGRGLARLVGDAADVLGEHLAVAVEDDPALVAADDHPGTRLAGHGDDRPVAGGGQSGLGEDRLQGLLGRAWPGSSRSRRRGGRGGGRWTSRPPRRSGAAPCPPGASVKLAVTFLPDGVSKPESTGVSADGRGLRGDGDGVAAPGGGERRALEHGDERVLHRDVAQVEDEQPVAGPAGVGDQAPARGVGDLPQRLVHA